MLNLFKVSHLPESTHGVHGWNFWHENDHTIPIKERKVRAFGYGFRGMFYGFINIGRPACPRWLIGKWDMDIGFARFFFDTRDKKLKRF